MKTNFHRFETPNYDSSRDWPHGGNERIKTLRNWGHFMNFGALYYTTDISSRSVDFSNYFVLANRGNVMVTSNRAIRDLFCRVYGFFKMQPECFSWIITYRSDYVNVARWFGWETKSDVFVEIDRDAMLFSTADRLYLVYSRFITYRFLYFIGCDVAFVLSSHADGGHYLDFRDRGIPTIGFDDGSVWAYTYGMPGGTSASTMLIYMRVLTMFLAEIRSSHSFWNLRANRIIF